MLGLVAQVAPGKTLWSTSVPTGAGLEASPVVRDRIYVRVQGYNDSGCSD